MVGHGCRIDFCWPWSNAHQCGLVWTLPHPIDWFLGHPKQDPIGGRGGSSRHPHQHPFPEWGLSRKSIKKPGGGHAIDKQRIVTKVGRNATGFTKKTKTIFVYLSPWGNKPNNNLSYKVLICQSKGRQFIRVWLTMDEKLPESKTDSQQATMKPWHGWKTSRLQTCEGFGLGAAWKQLPH